MRLKEIGGYIELDKYNMPMLHEEALALNCGRNCLAYLIKARKIKKILLPYFLCTSVREVCEKYGVEIEYYHINQNFEPLDIVIGDNDYLYIVNYYGQLSNEVLLKYKQKYNRVIIDNAQAYYQKPLKNTDTLYTCRKFFGVADGGFLYTDARLTEAFEVDYSFERMHFLLGRFEKSASEFYGEYVENNKFFVDEPIKQMSLLTKNLLHGIDYEIVKQRRTENFTYLHNKLKEINKLEVSCIDGAYMYPLLLEDAGKIREKLIREKIYIPILWPNVYSEVPVESIEWNYTKDILPLPCDQRYTFEDMDYLIHKSDILGSNV